MPTPKQMDELAAPAAEGRTMPAACTLRPGDVMPSEYWRAVMDDSAANQDAPRPSIGAQPLCDIQRHLLRVTCRRCGRIVEIQKADAVRLAGADAIWKIVGQRLLDDTCQQRTGRYEEDGCWPSFE